MLKLTPWRPEIDLMMTEIGEIIILGGTAFDL